MKVQRQEPMARGASGGEGVLSLAGLALGPAVL